MLRRRRRCHKKREIKKAQHRKENGNETKKHRERCACSAPQQPQTNKQHSTAKRERVLPPLRGIDRPARINQAKIRRPENLTEIKPKQPAGRETPVNE